MIAPPMKLRYGWSMRFSQKLIFANCISSHEPLFQEFQTLLKPYPEIELIALKEIIKNPEKLKWIKKQATDLETAIMHARSIQLGSHYPTLAQASEIVEKENQSTQLICTLVLIIEGILIHSTGKLKGTLTKRANKTTSLEIDNLFIPIGETRTLAELSKEEKNKISHHAQAVHSLMEKIKTHGAVFVKA